MIQLRALEPEDLEILFKWENNTNIWNVSNTLTPFSRFIIKQYLENYHKDIYELKELRLIIDLKHDNNKFTAIGLIDLFDFDPFHNRAGVGIVINNTNERGKNYATNALKLLIEYSFNYLKLNQLYCNIATSNAPSLKLFKNCGFEIIGTKKKWLRSPNGWEDEYFLQLINS